MLDKLTNSSASCDEEEPIVPGNKDPSSIYLYATLKSFPLQKKVTSMSSLPSMVPQRCIRLPEIVNHVNCDVMLPIVKSVKYIFTLTFRLFFF